MEKIGIKYRIPSVAFAENPMRDQWYTVSYKKTDDAAYTQVVGDYVVGVEGRALKDFEIDGLEEDTDYVIRLTNQRGGSFFENQIHTAINIENGESPIYLKKLFPGQSFNWFVPGLASLYVPANTGGWFFDLSGKFAENFEGFGPMEAPDGKSWVMRSSLDNAEEAYTCFNVGEGRVLQFNTGHANENARIFGGQFRNGSTMYGKFYMDSGAVHPVILLVSGKNKTTSGTDTFTIGVDAGTMLPYASFNSTVNLFSAAIQAGKWYTFAYRPGAGVSIYDGSGNAISSVSFSFVSNPWTDPVAYTDVPIYLGMPDGTTQGMNFCKMYLDPHSEASDTDRLKIISAYKYIATLIFERGAGSGTIFTPRTFVRVGDHAKSAYRATLDRKAFEVAVTCNVSGIHADNPVSMRVNSYLYQYADSTSFQAGSHTIELSDGTGQNMVFPVDNDFAYSGRFEVDVILNSGTVEQAATVKITEISVNGASVPLAEMFEDNGVLLVSDSNNGAALTEILVSEDVDGNISINIPALSSGGTLEKFVTPLKWVSRVSDSDIMVTIDPATPTGEWRMSVKTEASNRLAEMDIELVPVSGNLSDAFDVDFTNDFDVALAEFKVLFSGYHSQWGGYNGGCNSNLIYGDRAKKTLVFEQHGDNYRGSVNGVAKPAKDSSFNGYGTVAYHTAPNDPKEGQIRHSRVGSVATSNKYLGYGQIDTWAKMPVGTYGISLALWLFHYIELYPNDERWDYWMDRGGIPYGGADPYMVINNEIDIEFPSHNVNGEFASWTELASAYFDPLALDTQFKVGVEGDGTYQLVDTANPNVKTSWTKVSDAIMQRNFPYYRACKFNNWVGERSSGNGWAYTETDYAGEQYLALLTDLSGDYADGIMHKYTIKWYKDHSELWIDDLFVRDNRAFVPFNVCRWTIGGWFPSPTAEKYTPAKPGTWAGEHANFDVLHFEISRIKYTPFTEAEAGGIAELNSETYPEAGLRELL